MSETLFDMMAVYGRPALTDAQGKPKPASVRNLIGATAEMFACQILGLTSCPIDGSKKICHDAELADGDPVEIKSVGKNDRALIYKWRIEKEEKAHGREYRYLFVRHTCPITVTDSGAVADYFRDNPPALLFTTIGAIRDHAIKDTPPRTFRMFTGEAGKMTVAPKCDACHGAPEGTACPDCGTPPPPKFDRKKHHGSQRAGYVDGGWQFALKKIPRTREESRPFTWRGKEITVKIQYS